MDRMGADNGNGQQGPMWGEMDTTTTTVVERQELVPPPANNNQHKSGSG